MNFILNKNCTIVKNKLTKKFQRYLRSNINESQLIVQKYEGWKYINRNPTHPKKGV